jgi:hypothetical protein
MMKMMVIQVEVFWIVMPCSGVVGYQCFGGCCCFHLQGVMNGNGKKDTEVLVESPVLADRE